MIENIVAHQSLKEMSFSLSLDISAVNYFNDRPPEDRNNVFVYASAQ